MCVMAASPGVYRVTECFSPLVNRGSTHVINFSETEEYKSCRIITRTSDSSELTIATWKKYALNKKRLKGHVRAGVSPNVRKNLWLGVLGVTDGDSVLIAKAFGEPNDGEEITRGASKSFALPFDLDYIAPFYVIPAFGIGLERVLCGIKQSLDKAALSAPLVPILATLMLHFLEEWEVFAGLSILLRRHGWLDHEDTHLTTSTNMLLFLLDNHMKPTAHALERSKPPTHSMDMFLRELVERWYTWPFYLQPFWITVRVVDMFLLEGPKVLYRLALSALKLFASRGAVCEDSPLHTRVSVMLCTLSPEEKTAWFKEAFSVPLASWTKILSMWNSRLIAVKRCTSSEPDGPSLPTYNRKVVADQSSEILSADAWSIVWSWLPEWVTSETPQCLFRSSRDGYNLRTLYRKCEDLPSILLLVRTTHREVFGAFIATELQERHSAQFFGTGETMLFTLTPEPKCFQWTGENDFILRCNDQELIVGSGGGHFGLWLDGELDKGTTSSCTAFKNTPLTGRDELYSQFTCAVVEVYNCC